MLGWRELSRGKRAGAVFILLVILIGGPGLIMVAKTQAELLQYLGSVVVGFAVVLNPASFTQPTSTLISFRAMPVVCRVLNAIGLPLFVFGWALKHFGVSA